MGPIEELLLFDESNCWPNVFMKVRLDAMMQHDFSLKVSKKPEFKNRNRYGDVSPYDYSRICLVKNNIDYINASLVKHEDANRAYILTQGPLPGTSGHFWLMVWEQKSRAVLMLNKIVEKGHVKCHQYYPTGCHGDEEMSFEDVGLKVIFVEEMESNRDFAIRVFQLQNTETLESVQVMQFHYIAWPDFGVPESPSAFLDFLFAVRSFGVLDNPDRPPIIHCSAGIGRSGTFCLADTCLILIEKAGSLENLKVLETLMEMRKYRMGLIQTHEQLRFSYLAIIEGASRIDCLSRKYVNSFGGQDNDRECNEAADDTVNANQSLGLNSPNIGEDLPPIPPRSVGSLSEKTQPVAMETPSVPEEDDASPRNHVPHQNGCLPTSNNISATSSANVNVHHEAIRRRKHEERVKKTKDMVERMKSKQQECESSGQRSQFGILFYGGMSLAVVFLGYAAYKFMSYPA